MENSELIHNMIDNILDNKNSEAQETFKSLLSQKLNDALEAKKVEVAQSIYGTQEVQEPDESVEDTEQETEQT
ncbi:MAG: hypothetical protein EBS19_06385 [Spirochaetia bacterium]|nr:hypothetical protein [Spirochaetia bacterium]